MQTGSERKMNIRNAATSDAEHLAFLLNVAGEGLPIFLWRQMTERGQDPLAVGALRASRAEGAFSYRNARIADIDGSVAGMVLSYALPDPYEFGDLEDVHPAVRPLLELEAEVPGSWYVNAIATYEQYRGQGVGTALMSACQDMARAALASKVSLIVASANSGARGLYLKLGYQEVASRPLVTYPGGPDDGRWLLMVRHSG
jgi:ribosomal protein S18 acetylase RimI-like enzyme